MNRYVVASLLVGILVANPAIAQEPATEYEAIRRDIAALSERLQKLEQENAALKQQNEELVKAMQGQTPVPAPAVAQASSPTEPKPAPAPWYENVKVSGYGFGDAYGLIDHHDAKVENQTGFWIRRAYLTVDSKVSDTWSARLRFEVNSPGDFTTSGPLDPYVKDAYLAWKDGGRELYLGISPTPSFDFIEGFWGYRHIEKTPLDLYRMAGSRDFGVAYKGTAHDGKVFYHAMLGNGSGVNSETNEGKKGMFSLGFNLTDALTAQLYADYEDRPNSGNRTTYQGFLAWNGERSHYGLLYAWQNREVQGGPDKPVSVASIFGAWDLTEKSTLVARYDRSFEGYSDASKIPYLVIADNTEFDFALLAWNYQLHKQISFGPNLEYVMYHETNGFPAPENDLMIRGTLYYQF